MPFCEPDTFGYFRKKSSIFLRKAQFFWKVVRGVFTEVEQRWGNRKKVSERLSGHRSSIKKHANTFIARHFNLPGHTVDDIGIQPIEHITQSPGETELDVTIRRLDRERFWMLELGTMYPYGLNDRLQHVGNVSHSYVRSRNNVFNLFNRHQRRKRSHGRRSNSRRNSEITLDQLRNL